MIGLIPILYSIVHTSLTKNYSPKPDQLGIITISKDIIKKCKMRTTIIYKSYHYYDLCDWYMWRF